MTPTPGHCDADRDVSARRQNATDLSPAVLDLEGLRNRCMGNIELLQHVLEKFQQRLPEELAELEKMLELRDAERIAQRGASHQGRLGQCVGAWPATSRGGHRRPKPHGPRGRYASTRGTPAR